MPALVQLPVNCAPGTGVPLPLSSVRVTVPPVPPNCDGLASRIRLPLAVIGAVFVVFPAVNVRPGVPLLPPPLAATAM